MYSQNNEEQVILDVFGKATGGKFLDIGAFDPKRLSNTRALYELGWSGVFVEPSPDQFNLFVEEYDGDPNISLCNKAIAPTAGEMTFYISPNDALSTLSTEHLKKWNTVKFETSTVSTITVDMLFDEYGYDFDFIDLDVEGSNWELLQLIPFDKLPRLRLICVEYDYNYDAVVSHMTSFGFKLISRNGENVIMEKM